MMRHSGRLPLVLLAAAFMASPLSAQAQQAPPQGRQGRAGNGQDAGVEVRMTEALQFAPRNLTISQGESIVWVNSTRLTHTVTADPSKAKIPAHAQLPPGAAPFDSGNIGPGGQYRHTFDVPGTYRYFCQPHELAGMVGTIVVEPKPGAQSPR